MNGRTATTGETADPTRDDIRVDGRRLPSPETITVLALHKPSGYVTTVSDPHAEHTVMELLADCPERVYPVGRLDQESEGLLLFTNDGDLAFRLSHPRFGVEKTYWAWIEGQPGDQELTQLRSGIGLEEGLTAPAKVEPIRRDGSGSLIELTIHEGRKRQVRRMFEAIGHRVKKLVRVRYGPIKLGSLQSGTWRRLANEEVEALRAATRRV